MRRGGQLFVNDYGMRVTVLSRFGLKPYSVVGRDYEYNNGDSLDLRYSNITIKNFYHGVIKQNTPKGEMYRSRIHINGYIKLGLFSTPEEADALELPPLGTRQTGTILEGIKKARALVSDKPFFAECIGPFSLAGRLMNVNEIMIDCYDEPEMVETIMQKATAFIKDEIQEFKNLGADGVIMAEPLTGVLSPNLAREFSHPYVKEIIDAVQDDSFSVIYHNCGNDTVHMLEDIFALGAKAYHFGDSVDMKVILEKTPDDVLAMGNVSPAQVFVSGTPESVREATLKLMSECASNKNFWISSIFTPLR